MIKIFPTIDGRGYVVEKEKGMDVDKATKFAMEFLDTYILKIDSTTPQVYTVFSSEDHDSLSDEELEESIILVRGWFFSLS